VVLERPLVIKRSITVVRWSVGRRVGADQELVDCQTIGGGPPPQKLRLTSTKLNSNDVPTEPIDLGNLELSYVLSFGDPVAGLLAMSG
jgi:hypothetical protein